MAVHRRIGSAGHRQTRNTKTRRRARVVGAGTAAGAFLAFGMTPLATAPSAHADDFGLGDLIANLITGGAAGLPDSVVDPSALDLGSLLDPGALGLGADHATTLAASADALPSISDPFGAASSQSFNDFIQTLEQDWITSPFGQQVDNLVNTTSGEFLIGNGANGTSDSTLAAADGGNGGSLFGDGGNGGVGGEVTANGTGGVATGAGTGGGGGTGGNGGTDGVGGTGGNGGAGGAATANGSGGIGLPVERSSGVRVSDQISNRVSSGPSGRIR